jgi:hypothetical protein
MNKEIPNNKKRVNKSIYFKSSPSSFLDYAYRISSTCLCATSFIYSGAPSTSDEGGTQSDISIESENTVLHDLSILINESIFFKWNENVMIKLVAHKQVEEILYA